MLVGVFDSGVGGLSVANAIKTELPELEILLRDDRKHLPYGTKTPAELISFVTPILKSMVGEGCQIIVVACNTVTTTIIGELRQAIAVPLIAIEPMVKPAAKLTKSGVIAVCATPTTLASDRYKYLKETYAKNIKVIEPDCSDWVYLIENKKTDRQAIDSRINQALKGGADVIVLACTHYHWIEGEIVKLVAGKASVLEPEKAIIRQLQRVLGQLA